MTETTSLALIQSIINSETNLVVILQNEKPILTNTAFNNFFNVSSLSEYESNFGSIVDSFVPHPSYFHKEKIKAAQSWLDAIMELDEQERIVSMLTRNFDPCAFSVQIDRSIDEYSIVKFTDITRDLIKRIMIENNINIDKKSGAYDKKYFMEISQNYEDAAVFNEKVLGIILASVDMEANPNFSHDEKALKEFVAHLKDSTRQDDMLVRWDEGEFLLVYLVDNEENAKQMLNKIKSLVQSGSIKSLGCKLKAVVQQENESIKSLIKRVQL